MNKILVVVVVLFSSLISTIQAGGSTYTWNNTCTNNCVMETPSYWSKSGSGPPSPVDNGYCFLHFDQGQSVNASSLGGSWDIGGLWIGNCNFKKTVQEIQGTVYPVINLEFKDTTMSLGSPCIGVSDHIGYITFRNTTLTAYSGDYYTYNGGWKFIDSDVNFSAADFYFEDFYALNSGIFLEFINTKFIKNYVSKTGAENTEKSGFRLVQYGILKINNSNFTLPSGLYTALDSQFTISGVSYINANPTQTEQMYHWVRGNMTINENANVTLDIPLHLHSGGGAYPIGHYLGVNAKLYAPAVELYPYSSFTFDVHGSVITESLKLILNPAPADVILKLHSGSSVFTNVLTTTQFNTKREVLGTEIAAVVIEGGSLDVSGGTTLTYSGSMINITGGSAHFIGSVTVNAATSFNFLGGDVTFDSDFIDYNVVSIKGSIVTFKGGVSTSGALNISSGGVILANSIHSNGVTLTGGYLAGYGTIEGNVVVKADAEVRLTSISNPLNVTSGEVTAEVVIEGNAKITISANDVGCAQANVQALNLHPSTIFEVSFSGAPPANNSECTILKYTTFSGSVPSQPITEPTYGATLTITNDENAKEIKVQITLPPPPPAEPNTPSNTPPSNEPTNTPLPTNTPNSGSKIIVGFGTVLFAFFTLFLISFLN